MDVLRSPPVEPSRPGAFSDSQWRPILLSAVAAMVVSVTVVTVVAAIGTTVAQLAAVVATANAESAARPPQAHAQTTATCGVASR
ncbi:MAG: hypothetical protein AB7F22_21010 [Reyranella sp.]|uniref:hypothetical protein n=1 Tax=Reyranella sp. TaxID=1929291 RepID=UPI003D09E8B4